MITRLKDFLTIDNGIFTAIKAVDETTYNELFPSMESSLLDTDFYTRYQYRTIAPICETMGSSRVNDIAKILLMHYAGNWKKLYTDLTEEYKLFAPYHLTRTRTRDNNYTSKGDQSGDNTTYVKGINSTEENESEKTSNTANSNREDTTKETVTTETEGNTGNAVLPDVLAKEIEVRKNYFLDIVFTDIANYLTLYVYD